MCKRCKKNYHVPCPEAAEFAIRKDGFITDNAMLSLSTRENVLKLYVDRGEAMCTIRYWRASTKACATSRCSRTMCRAAGGMEKCGR